MSTTLNKINIWNKIKAWFKGFRPGDVINFGPGEHIPQKTMTTDEFARLFKQAMREGKLKP